MPLVTYIEIAQKLEDKILKDYGQKCPDFNFSCSCCLQWMALDIILDAAAIERNSGWNEVYKNRKEHKYKSHLLYGK